MENKELLIPALEIKAQEIISALPTMTELGEPLKFLSALKQTTEEYETALKTAQKEAMQPLKEAKSIFEAVELSTKTRAGQIEDPSTRDIFAIRKAKQEIVLDEETLKQLAEQDEKFKHFAKQVVTYEIDKEAVALYVSMNGGYGILPTKTKETPESIAIQWAKLKGTK